jgi:hypothetical protein
MSKKISKQTIISQYIETCDVLKETTLNGDYKRGNKEYKKIIKVFKIIELDLALAEESLPCLFDNENVVTRAKAASHCIALNLKVEDAKKVLQDIADDECNGIFGFNAKMTLQVLHEQGFLKVY